MLLAGASRKSPAEAGLSVWRPRSELNRRTRICSPLHNHSATRPDDVWRFGFFHIAHALAMQQTHERAGPGSGKNEAPRTGLLETGAGKGTRTLDPDLGKVVLYQLSYSRVEPAILRTFSSASTPSHKLFSSSARSAGQAARTYSKPDHRVRIAASASSHSPTTNTGIPSSGSR